MILKCCKTISKRVSDQQFLVNEKMTIKHTRLENGLQVLSQHMPDAHSISLGAWVGAGARHETATQHGLAHLLEHMAFKGTTTRSALDIVQQIEAVGGDVNAGTSLERTAYYVRVLKEDLGLAVDILGDILINPVFAEDELTREKGVILSEIGQHLDTPDDVAFDVMRDLAYPGHAMGRNILGTTQTVSDFSKTDLVSFRSKYYNPSNMLIAAAGNISHKSLVDKVATAFSLAHTGHDEKLQKPIFVGGEATQEKDIEQAHLVLGFEGVSLTDPDHYTAQILSMILGGGMSSRLFQEVREKRGLAYSIYSFCWSFSDSGLFGVYTGTNSEDIGEGAQVIVDELYRASKQISEEEIATARSQIKAGLLMGLESSYVRAERMARQYMTFGREVPLEEILGEIDAVNADHLTTLAGRVFDRDKMSAALIGPEGHSLTDRKINTLF